MLHQELTLPFVLQADRRFVWNQYLLVDFSRNELAEYCIPIIYGFISINKIKLNSREFTLIIISRRSVDRAGTRMFSRGADENGFASNFVETEQIVLFQSEQASFVQLRGSIPLHWSQLPDLRYKPPPTLSLSQSPSQLEVFSRHLSRLLSQYEAVVLLNLVNHSGQEEVLKSKLQQVFYSATAATASSLTNMHLESFDFHAECRHGRWDRLSILIKSISRYIDLFGYFASSSEEYRYQRGVFRTNCIDSLDRTNVVQSLIAKTSLERQLQHFGVIAVGQRVEDFPAFYSVYRNVWADNADACSIQYAGTPALKTDFTRTGKRRFVGKLKDGVNSMVRYFKNNFEDGFRQDAIDLVLGNYQVKLGEGHTIKCPLASRNVLKIFTSI
ncbi:Phosphatidylinositide phosphatase SAC1 [Tyrophagus putrescentiae]|nr:Phosphatidylinositide phosphatase SAC1 [Tyrophagus putrescentiae]